MPDVHSRIAVAWFLMCIVAISIKGIAAEPACVSQTDSAGQIIGVDGTALPYRQTVIGAELPGPYALVLFLHGAGERGNDNVQHLVFGYKPMTRYCVDNGIKAVLLFPQCPKRKLWSAIRIPDIDPPLTPEPTPPLAAAVHLLCGKIVEYEPKHVLAVGISMGGYGVWDLLTRYPDMFTAGMAICGGGDVEQAETLKDIPIYVAHGTSDILVPVVRSRSMVRAIWNAGGERVVYREFPLVGHDVWNNVFADDTTWEWLFKRRGEISKLSRLRNRFLPMPKTFPYIPVPRVLPWQSRLF